MKVVIEESWHRELAGEFEEPYFAELAEFVRGAYRRGPCYPPPGLIFNAFAQTPFDAVKVVILGQDPYHEPGQAQGLAFYVPPEVTPPPSLRNIAKELGHMPDLMSWARQGVLLLNATLTVAAHQAGSHQGRGWERFTDAVVRALAERREELMGQMRDAEREIRRLNRAERANLLGSVAAAVGMEGDAATEFVQAVREVIESTDSGFGGHHGPPPPGN